MARLIPSNLPTIMQATEQRLLAFVSTISGVAPAGDISNIYWILAGDEPPPGATGQRDILLVEHEDKTTNVCGAGRFTEIYSGIDVYLRSSFAADRKGTRRDWLIQNRTLIDGLMDSLMGFFPIDGSNNALTIEGFVLDTNATPAKNQNSQTWGEVVGTYRFHYIPNIDLSVFG